jgi:dTDP-4-amino-4,6-dideoxygalactose transaminase
MSNVVAGVVRGQYPYLEEHIARKKTIFQRYQAGFADLPVTMNPYDPESMTPNFWLSCILIDEDAMCTQERTETKTCYRTESGKTCPDEIYETLEKYNVESRPIWKPMHLQPVYREHAFVSCGTDVGADIFHRGLCLPCDIKMTAEEQDQIIEIVRSCFA